MPSRTNARKIKVVHIIEDLKIGGMERIIASIAQGVNKSKYAIEIWCLARGGDIADELLEKGVALKILGLNNYYNPLQIIALAKLLISGDSILPTWSNSMADSPSRLREFGIMWNTAL